jgi:creatinine amidohydrolase
LAPGSVRAGLVAGADDEDRTGGLVFRYTAESLSVNGVTGRPSEATPALGDRLLALTVDAVCELVDRGRVEEPPLVAHTPNPLRVAMATGGASGGSPC